MAATLANGGVNPLTGERVASARPCAPSSSVMATLRHVRLAPASGCTRSACRPRAASPAGSSPWSRASSGIAIFSPPLDAHGNSVRGVAVCRDLVQRPGPPPRWPGPPAVGSGPGTVTPWPRSRRSAAGAEARSGDRSRRPAGWPWSSSSRARSASSPPRRAIRGLEDAPDSRAGSSSTCDTSSGVDPRCCGAARRSGRNLRGAGRELVISGAGEPCPDAVAADRRGFRARRL